MEKRPPCAVELIELGRRSYAAARRVQEEIYRSLRSGARAAGALILVEHPDTITVGREPGSSRHVLASPEELGRLGVELVRADRGGDVTWHGPGQLLAYPIIPLRRFRKDVGWYLRSLEAVGVQTCRRLGVEASRSDRGTGVWCSLGKLMAIGVGVGGWVTYHGLALNCDPDLSRYGLIVPCGLRRARVASLSAAAGRRIGVAEAAGPLVRSFAEVFGIGALAGRGSPVPLEEVRA